MFNRDGVFGNKKDESLYRDPKPVNSNPGLASASSHRTAAEAPKSKPASTTEVGPAKPATAATEEPRGSRLIVGPDIKLKGVEITDCDTLVVEGRVEASMDSRVVRIAATGVFVGTVGIDVAEIDGCFEGELTARKHLVVHATGRVTGKIRYGRITIEEGGEVSGDIGAMRPAQGPVAHAESASDAGSDIMTPYDPFARKAKASAKNAPSAQT